MTNTFAEEVQSVLDAVACGAKTVTSVELKPNGNHEATVVFPQGTVTVRGNEANHDIAIVLNIGLHAGHCDAVADFIEAVIKQPVVEPTNDREEPKRARSKA